MLDAGTGVKGGGLRAAPDLTLSKELFRLRRGAGSTPPRTPLHYSKILLRILENRPGAARS